jgi:hypothetical protein
MTEYKYYTFNYRRHLTIEKAEALKKEWDYQDESILRVAQIMFKKKSNDYTVVLNKHYN